MLKLQEKSKIYGYIRGFGTDLIQGHFWVSGGGERVESRGCESII